MPPNATVAGLWLTLLLVSPIIIPSVTDPPLSIAIQPIVSVAWEFEFNSCSCIRSWNPAVVLFLFLVTTASISLLVITCDITTGTLPNAEPKVTCLLASFIAVVSPACMTDPLSKVCVPSAMASHETSSDSMRLPSR